MQDVLLLDSFFVWEDFVEKVDLEEEDWFYEVFIYGKELQEI